jgi:rRNA maturation protein Nop10
MFGGSSVGHRTNTTEATNYYAVCSECDFLRVLGKRADRATLPETCPACGAELVIQELGSRFQPAYVSRVSRALHRATI